MLVLHDSVYFQVELAGGVLHCGEFVTLRKVSDSNQKVIMITKSTYL